MMLLYQNWTGSNPDITLRRVHVREFPVNIMLPRYCDCSCRANAMLIRGQAPTLDPITQISVVRVLRYPRFESFAAFVPTEAN